MNLRPVQILRETTQRYPKFPNQVEVFRDGRGKDLPNWPDWCFLPMAAWYSMISAHLKVPLVPIHMTGEVAKLSALGTWRYSQGIYRIDPDFMLALTNSPISGNLPCEVLLRLPEWCIYIETPGLRWLNQMLHGFWTHLEWDANTGRHELRLLLDCENDTLGLPLHLGDWSTAEAMDRAIAESTEQMEKAALRMPFTNDNELTVIENSVNPLVSIVLYLCSDKPKIRDDNEPEALPARATPKETRNGWRFVPPEKPRIWSVG